MKRAPLSIIDLKPVVPVPGNMMPNKNMALIKIAHEGQTPGFLLQKLLTVIFQNQPVFSDNVSSHVPLL